MSPRGIDRKAVGGVVEGARHRMIALIRADGRLEKRVVWPVTRGWLRVNVGRGESRCCRRSGRRFNPRSRNRDGSLADESATSGRAPRETQPPREQPWPHPRSYPRHWRLLN